MPADLVNIYSKGFQQKLTVKKQNVRRIQSTLKHVLESAEE